MSAIGMIFAKSGMGYAGLWDRGGVQMMVDHLRRRSGELHGELVVMSAVAPVSGGRLHRASFNVSSTVARERLAKALADRSRVELPWGDYLEDFASAVLEAEREGAPIIRVGTLPAPQNEGYLIDPLLVEGKPTILYARGGTGKSYLATLCAVGVVTGTPVLGMPVRKGGVLYLDWETDQDEINLRVQRVSRGLGIERPAEIMYRRCASPLDEMAEQVASAVSSMDIRLVVVDSVEMASGAGREQAGAEEKAIRLFAAFRYIGATILAVDHVKSEDAEREDAVSKPYGSIYKMNLARSAWELKAAQQGNHMALYHRKVNNGPPLAPIGFSVVHGPDAVTFSREEIADAGLVRGLSMTARIMRALGAGAMTTPDLAEEIGAAEGSLRMALSRGRGTLFVRLNDGRWGLLRSGDEDS